jgi:hypothetical protein
MKQASIVLATLLAVGSISAYDAMAAAPAAEEAPKAEKKICRTEKSTGSLTRRTRICMTRAQWEALSARTRQGVQDFQNSASGSRVTPICDASGQGPGCGGVGSSNGVVGQ